MVAQTTKNHDLSRLAPPADHTLLVIGGCGGIGHAFVEAAVEANQRVYVMDLPDAIDRRGQVPSVHYVGIDLCDEASIDETFSKLKSLDVKFHSVAMCAGYTKGHDRIAELDTQLFDDIVNGNLRGPVLAMRACIPLLTPDAALVLLSTAIGQVGAAGYAGYGAAKAGLNAIVRILATELAPGIRVNGVAPGAVDTAFIRGGYGTGAAEEGAAERFDADAYNAMVPMGRMGVPNDIVGPMLFLLSDAARYITGQVLHVNGGAYLRD
ncbi:MAG: SDR family NAD(P)-dependent oxidoreductase [Woeseiaceae bacterium]